MLRALFSDDAGFIVSAELVLIATLLVLGLIVGMSQVQYAVVEELNDVAHALGSLNQGFYFSGFSAEKNVGCGTAIKSQTFGSSFHDSPDTCDYACNQITCDQPVGECGGWL
jgi:hypothetical protein